MWNAIYQGEDEISTDSGQEVIFRKYEFKKDGSYYNGKKFTNEDHSKDLYRFTGDIIYEDHIEEHVLLFDEFY